MQILEIACAKLNLGLDVIGRRADGYHELISVMQSISLCDHLYAEREAEGTLSLDTGGALPADDSNLIIRAARAYFAASGRSFGVRFRLEKNIPMQAGMGGGSADAAAALRALERLSDAPLGEEKLLKISAQLGADVPFCLLGGTQLCRGIGERMLPIKNRLPRYVVAAMAGEGVSTPAAFAALDAAFGDFALPAAEAAVRFPALQVAIEGGSTPLFSANVYNRFEDVIEPLRPAVAVLKQKLLAQGAYAARMSGSGPSVYGLFTSAEAAENAARVLEAEGIRAFSCEMLQ